MTISQAQTRKDLRLNIAYEDRKRKVAPLGKIGYLSAQLLGSPKARMPGILERFVIFWKAVYRARRIRGDEHRRTQENVTANKHRAQKYTTELLGKLQIDFVKVNGKSGRDRSLLSVDKTLGKLAALAFSLDETTRENARKEIYSVHDILNRDADVEVVADGIKYLMDEHKLWISGLDWHKRNTLHLLALAVNIGDDLTQGVLHFGKNGEGDYIYKRLSSEVAGGDDKASSVSQTKSQRENEPDPDSSRDATPLV